MAVREILKREAEKIFHEACLDRGYTVKQVINDKKYMDVRNQIVCNLDKMGFTQDLIAALIKRSRITVITILKGAE